MQDIILERYKISPFLVFYLILSMQIGIGILGFQRTLSIHSSQDAWISVLIAGLSLHVYLWMIYKIAETVNGDIVTAHIYVAGNLIGKLISSLFIVYFFINMLTVLRSYIEIIQVWMFPDLSTFWFSFAILLLSIYVINGGFRTVVGISFFGFILPSYLFLIFGYNLKFSNFNHLLPIWEHSLKDILLGSYHMSLTIIGFETVLFFYPFIKDPQKSKKWAHFALLSTTFIYTGLMVLTIAYFSDEQLHKSIWATLTMWKIVKMPFMDRFEYIGIATWMLVILPNICTSIWIASRMLKRIFHIQQKKGIYFITIVTLIVINFFQTHDKVAKLQEYTAKTGFVCIFIYIPLLFISVMIAKRVKKR